MDAESHARVLVVERDLDLRATMEQLLDESGYRVAATGDTLLAELALGVSEEPLVVVIGPGSEWEEAAPMLSHIPKLPPHVYVVLSTLPTHVRSVWNPYTNRYIPVVAAPFDLDTLLEQIDKAAAVARAIPPATPATTAVEA
jgi:DNA-binding NtrC family response regulator